MIIMAVATLVFIAWLIGRRWLRIIAVCALVLWIGQSVVIGYQEAGARAEARF